MSDNKEVEQQTVTDFGDRLKDVRKKLKISQKDFAARMGITGGYMSEIEYGKAKPGFDFFIKVARLFDVNINWLLFGRGEMFFSEKEGIRSVEDDLSGHDEKVKEILRYFKKSPLVKFSVMAYAIKFLHDNEEAVKKDMESNILKSNQGEEK